MGFKKTFGILVLLMLFLMPMIVALDTPIKIISVANSEVTIRVLNIDSSAQPRTLEGGDFIDQNSGDDGIVEVVFSSEAPNSNKFDISIMRRKNGVLQKYQDGSSVRLINNDGEHIKSGWPVEIDVTIDPPILTKSGKSGGVESEIAITETNESETTGNDLDVVVEIKEEPVVEENTEEIDAEISSGITGKAITGIKGVATSKITYYILGAIVLILVIIFVLKKKLLKKILPKKKGSIEFGVKKDGNKKESMSTREELEDAEKKLDEAKKELEEVKGKNEKEEKIRQIKARFNRDKAALEELEKE